MKTAAPGRRHTCEIYCDCNLHLERLTTEGDNSLYMSSQAPPPLTSQIKDDKVYKSDIRIYLYNKKQQQNISHINTEIINMAHGIPN